MRPSLTYNLFLVFFQGLLCFISKDFPPLNPTNKKNWIERERVMIRDTRNHDFHTRVAKKNQPLFIGHNTIKSFQSIGIIIMSIWPGVFVIFQHRSRRLFLYSANLNSSICLLGQILPPTFSSCKEVISLKSPNTHKLFSIPRFSQSRKSLNAALL